MPPRSTLLTRSTPFALALAAALGTLAALAPARATAQGTQGTSGSQAAGPADVPRSELALHNQGTDTARVEIRVGSAATCDTIAAVAVHQVPPQRQWLIISDLPVCWRRAVDHRNPQAGWNAWHRQLLAPGQHVDTSP